MRSGEHSRERRDAETPRQAALPHSRRRFVQLLGGGAGALCSACSSTVAAVLGEDDPGPPLIVAPDDPADWPAFREQLKRWRREVVQRLRYEGALYGRPEFAWAARCFSCCFLMAFDEMFHEVSAGRYRVAEFAEHGRREFGGYDAVVLWHAYPRIGVDDRNQFDYYRDLPGGILGVRDVVREFQSLGVKVFIDYNPWDTGTRREPKSDLDTLAVLVQALEVDGIFLDTMDRGAAEFRNKLDAVRPGVALEGEIALPLERVHDHHLSWAQWFQDSRVPGVLRNKWFERRHLQHQIRRWDTDHSGELHTAWMNGSGMLIWENVFGSWVGWSPRDRSILRALLPIQRRYADLFTGERWTPLVPTVQADVCASLWEGRGLRLWTLVNRANRVVDGELLPIEPVAVGDVAYFDLIYGTVAAIERKASGRVVVAGKILPRGIGCLIEGNPEALGEDWETFLASQRAVAAREDWRTTAEERRTALSAPPVVKAVRRVPRGMVAIPAVSTALRMEMRVRECGFYESVPSTGHRLGDSYRHQLQSFERSVRLGRYAIDRTPVTNAQFGEFLRAAQYRPAQAANFLKHWGHGHAPFGQEDHPVVYVNLDDARAYARWARKRLPSEEEWQYAAQGAEGRRYPWGEVLDPGRCNDGSQGATTTSVTAFPKGASPFGLLDLCGNVWEWTESERSDGRTRFCILKGGSFFTAKGSGWYFDGGPQANAYSAKFLRMGAGLDRCATIGFRCAVSLRGGA